MAVPGHVAVSVVDLDQIAVSAHPSGVGDGAAVRGVDGRPSRDGDVDALVVGGPNAAGGAPPAETGGDASRGGPAEAAGGQPGGPVLRALETVLRDGLAKGDAGEDRPLDLRAVDIGDVGHRVRRAELAGGGHFIIALVKVGAVRVLHVEGHAVHVPLLLDHGHGQVGHGGGHGEDFADLQLVDVVAGVQGQQLVGGEAVVLGDLGPGVPLGHRVGDLGGLGAVKGLRQEAQVHQAVGGDKLLLHFHVLGEGDGDGALVGGGELDLLQKLLQRPLVGRGADALSVHVQAVGGGDHAHLLAQLLLVGLLVHQVLAAEQAGGVLNQGIVDGEAPAQGLGGDPFQLGPGLLGLRLAGEGAQHLPVIGDGDAVGIGGDEQHRRRRHAASRQEDGGVNPPAALFLGALGTLLPGGAVLLQHPLLEEAGPHGQQPPEKQHQLNGQPLGLREAVGLVLPDDAPPAAAEVQALFGDGLPGGTVLPPFRRAGLPGGGAPALPAAGGGGAAALRGPAFALLRLPVPDGGREVPVLPGAPALRKVLPLSGGFRLWPAALGGRDLDGGFFPVFAHEVSLYLALPGNGRGGMS